MIPQHDVTDKEVTMVRVGNLHVRILDMEGVYQDDDEYIVLQHYENGERKGAIPIPKDDVPGLIEGLEWTIEATENGGNDE